MTIDHEDSEPAPPSNLPIASFLSLISADSLEVILKELVERTKEWMQVTHTALWWIDLNHNRFRMLPAGKSGKKTSSTSFIPYETADGLGLVSSEEPVEISEQASHKLEIANLRGSLAARINYYERTSGILVVFPHQQTDSWSNSDRELLKLVARTGAELCKNFEEREKLDRLVKSLQEMTEKNTTYDLYDVVLREVKAILQCDRGVVRGLNLQNGHLTYERSDPHAPEQFNLPPGEGITSLALQQRKVYRIPDVTAEEWASKYRCLWPNLSPTRSELALPILHRKYRVRVKTKDDYVDKPLGVLNFESPTIAAFSKLDQDCGEIIAQRIAPIMERIEYESKLAKVRRASHALATKRDWDSIVDTLLNAIRDSLGYEFVSLSVVDHDADVIRCVRVLGLSDTDAAEFKKRALHKLGSDHVQADVVHHRRIEVPAPDDPRLSKISDRFGLDRFIRVFVPMVVPEGEVIGTISAGYERTYREHIYWRDVQLLRILALFGANAMELWQRGNIDRVSHEMNAPLTAVRANLESLRKRWRLLSNDQIDQDLEDMETDTNLLYYQVQQLDYVIGGRVVEAAKQPLHLESVRLFGDIIFKTINQLKMLVRDKGLDPRKITYVEGDIRKIPNITLDKSKISQVIFNLFMNAVKYVDSPETFKIQVGAEEQSEYYVIKFCDWGIGVPEGLEEKIFEDRFRAPLVQGVRGSGLGLTIARQLMREHGGDLILKHPKTPTEFHLVFPKQSRRIS
jgi:signal transduction histidine kinase